MAVEREFDLLVAGELNPDIILASPGLEPRFGQVETLVDEASLSIGSSSAILACGAARLGLQVAFVGVVGKDIFGDFMLGSLAKYGIDTSSIQVDEQIPTGLTVILNRGADRAILTSIGAMSALKAEMISDDLLARCRHLHVSSYYLQSGLQPGLPGLFRRALDLNLTTSLDTNWDPDEHWKGIPQILPLTNVFLPNEREACSITKHSSVGEAAFSLHACGPIVAIKLGSAGGMVCYNHHLNTAPALQVQVVDTVGAGDSFDAGFLYGFLNNWDINRCLCLAVACGSLSTRGRGGTSQQPTLPEAMQYL